MSVRFVHIADTHLGAGGFGNKLTETGLNQREEDLCRTFSEAVTKTIELEPDFVIHSGDLFHTVRPTNRMINFAMREILRLTQAGLPFVIISGNHDAPKQRAVGHVLSIFENLSNVFAVYKSRYEVVRLGEVAIGCLPHCLSPELLRQECERVRPAEAARANILVAHGVAAGLAQFKMGDVTEEELPSSLFSGFDYTALGHYHRHTLVEQRVCYAGSTERLSFGELGEEKGFVEVSLPEGELRFHRVATRPMIELPEIDAKGLSYEELERRIRESLETDRLPGAIARLRIRNLGEALYANLPVKEIKQATERAFHFKLVLERADKQVLQIERKVRFGRLWDEFRAYLEHRPLEGISRETLLRRAEEFFQQIEE